MLNFQYDNRTRYVFGEGEHKNIGTLLKPFAPQKVLLHYGSGSVKRTGVFDAVTTSLKAAGIEYVELGGVKANPSVELVRKGVELCRAEGIGFVLAVGGGSVIDSAKGIAVGVTHAGDVWKLYTKEEKPYAEPLPVAVVLTLPAAGSENSPNSVLTNESTGRKLGYRGDGKLRPVLSVVDPTLFLSLPPIQMSYGACDMLSHIFERYFTNTPDTDLSDALCEATMRTILKQASILRRDPNNVKAWGQLALAGTVAHNDLLGVGREQSWACHALEHELSAVYDVPHGGGLAVVIPAYMEAVYKHSPGIFCQWAINVMGVEPNRDIDAIIREGIRRLRYWYKELGLPQTMQELGVPHDADFESMAAAACRVHGGTTLGGVHPIGAEEAYAIYNACNPL